MILSVICLFTAHQTQFCYRQRIGVSSIWGVLKYMSLYFLQKKIKIFQEG